MLVKELAPLICVRRHTQKINETWPTLSEPRLVFRAQRTNLAKAGSGYEVTIDLPKQSETKDLSPFCENNIKQLFSIIDLQRLF